MKQFNKNFILLLFLALAASSMTFAREPAVQPVTGISIDQYDDVPPAKATPYDFTQNEKSKKLTTKPKNVVKKMDLKTMNESTSSGSRVIVILMVSLLPIAVWLGLMKGVKSLDEEEPSKIVDLDSKRNNDDDDDLNFPKAS